MNARYLNELEKQLQRLEAKKCDFLTELDRIETEIKCVKAEHGRLINHSADIYRLPNEILVYIFKTGQCEIGPGKKFEVLVSHVSSHWRAVALASPSLWTNISRTMSPNCTGKLGVEVYLERSKACPLDISFHLDSSEEADDATLISLIVAHVGRWRQVFIHLLDNNSYERILQGIRHSSAPLLEHFSLSPYTPFEVHSNDNPQIFTGGAPRLTFVRLTGINIHHMQPPFGAVTTLHLEDLRTEMFVDYVQFSDIIHSSPVLVNLSLYGLVINNWPMGFQPPLPIPTLRSLRVQGSSELVYNLMSGISAPHLDSLFVADCADDEGTTRPWDIAPDRYPTPPKFPHLRTLTFTDCYLPSETCRKVFRAFPTITHFALLGSFSIDILKALGDDCTLPSDLPWAELHTLTLEKLESAQEHLLCTSVLAGRKQLGRPITTLRLESQLKLKLKRRGKLEWVEKVVEVVKWSGLERWPPGLDFEDVHDPF